MSNISHQKHPVGRLLLCAVVSEIAYLSLYIFPHSNAWLFGKYIATAGVCFGVYAVALSAMKRATAESRGGETPPLQSMCVTPHLVLFIIGCGLLFRLSVMALPPFTSDDMFRYIWDGHVQHAGISPYAYPPDDVRLSGLRDRKIYPNINHPDVPTIYPPLAQMLFWAAYGLAGDGFWGIKLLLLVSELATMLIVWRMLVRTGRASPGWVVAYAWCPLPILEFFIGGHPDGFGMPWVALFLYWILTKREIRAAAALGCAVLIKFVPLILVPWVFRQLDWRRRAWFLATLGGVCALGYLPFWVWSPESNPFYSLGNYLQNWSFNAPVFWLAKECLGHGAIARKVCLACFAAWTVWVTFFEKDGAGAVLNMWLGFFLFAPTVYPWYLTWVVPVLVLKRPPPVFWLLAASQVSYVVMIGWLDRHVWYEPPWVLAVEFIPLLIWAILKVRHSKSTVSCEL